jgi:hypothetical protein
VLLTLFAPQGTLPPAAVQAWVKVAGTWQQATPFVRVAGTWRQATPSVKVAGVWE